MRRAFQPVRRAWRASLLKDLGRNFPVDVLKIDRSFVRDITSSEDAAAMVAAIIEPACGPRMRVIAEGVETEASSTTSGGAAWRILNAESAMAYRRKRRPRLYLRR